MLAMDPQTTLCVAAGRAQSAPIGPDSIANIRLYAY